MMRVCVVSLAACLACAAGQVPDWLLPDDVVPVRHTVELIIDPSRPSFTGQAHIEVNLHSRRDVIWINGKDLQISEASVEFGGKAQPAKVEIAGGEFIGLIPAQPVGPGLARLDLRYQAPLSAEAVSGPYRKEVDGEWYAFTVFTPMDARRAFPCFDEPRFKTPWQMSIRVKTGNTAFGNAPLKREIDDRDGSKMFEFAPTQPIPAEVVAFAVGPFDVLEGPPIGSKHTPVRVITPKGQSSQGQEALLATADVLPREEEYIGIPYPWEKLDHVALPKGAFGAIENPGLITYVSRGLLVEPGQATPEKLNRVRALEAHEIGHQWFGNLVTQSTWEDVWLSEGFATWFAAKIMDQRQPPARLHLNAVIARERIMATDVGPKTHPVRVVLHNRGEMKTVYNRLVYEKGAAILMMLEHWLGEERFRDDLRAYLKAHALSNATTADLAAALGDAAVLHSFLDQPGIPELRVEVRCPSLIIEQKKIWTVPVCWRAPGAATETCTVVDGPRKEIPLSGCPAWIYPNAGGTGYYRTEWTKHQLASMGPKGAAGLSAAERLTLAYDLRAQVKAARLNRRAARPILTRLTTDSEPEIASAAKEALGGTAPGLRSK